MVCNHQIYKALNPSSLHARQKLMAIETHACAHMELNIIKENLMSEEYSHV